MSFRCLASRALPVLAALAVTACGSFGPGDDDALLPNRVAASEPTSPTTPAADAGAPPPSAPGTMPPSSPMGGDPDAAPAPDPTPPPAPGCGSVSGYPSQVGQVLRAGNFDPKYFQS